MPVSAGHLAGLGDDGQVGDVRDAGQRLAAEAVRANAAQVVELVQLAGGEALAHQLEVLLVDARAVVLDLQQLQAAVSHRHL